MKNLIIHFTSSIIHIKRPEIKVSSYILKWLVPPCCSSINGSYGNDACFRSGAAWESFGLVTSFPTLHKSTSTQQRKLVVARVHWYEEEWLTALVVCQAKQGHWTTLVNLDHSRLTWKDLWEMEGNRIIFIIRATYDGLPTRLTQRISNSKAYPYQLPNHSPGSQATSSNPGAKEELCHSVIPQTTGFSFTITFVPVGKVPGLPATSSESSLLDIDNDWEM